jgi:nucleotide-binding universal stress UspA family protein
MNVEVVNVWEHVDSTLMVAGMGFGSDAYVGESDPKVWSDQILQQSVSQIFGTRADQVKVTSVEGGAVRTLVEMSKNADLLVMGSRGHGKLTDLILGSVSASCSAKSKCPVLIVHGPVSSNN